ESWHDRKLLARARTGSQAFDERRGVRQGARRFDRQNLPGLDRQDRGLREHAPTRERRFHGTRLDGSDAVAGWRTLLGCRDRRPICKRTNIRKLMAVLMMFKDLQQGMRTSAGRARKVSVHGETASLRN